MTPDDFKKAKVLRKTITRAETQVRAIKALIKLTGKALSIRRINSGDYGTHEVTFTDIADKNEILSVALNVAERRLKESETAFKAL